MRVATFNILHGRTVGDGVDPQRLRECVRHLDLYDRPCKKSTATKCGPLAPTSPRWRPTRWERWSIGLWPRSPALPERRGWPLRAMSNLGPRHTGSLLSRFPVASWQVVRLPRIPMRFRCIYPAQTG